MINIVPKIHMLDIGHVKVYFFDLPKMSDMPLCQVRLVFVKIGDRTQYRRPLYECPKGGVTSPIFGTFQSNTESAAAQRINRHAHGSAKRLRQKFRNNDDHRGLTHTLPRGRVFNFPAKGE